MQLLATSAYAPIFQRYYKHEPFFPIIGAVLENTQNGQVFADDVASPTVYFVVHDFGFAQLFAFGAPPERVDEMAQQLLNTKLPITATALRWYDLPEILSRAVEVTPRSHFTFKGAAQAGNARAAVSSDMPALEQFGYELDQRFWRSEQEFLAHSMAHIVEVEGVLVSICYAASVSGGRAEVDIATLPDYQGKGYATSAARSFVTACQARGIEAHWDCYHNNAGSMALAKRLGFTQRERYLFTTISV